jgi:biotin carboxylase
VTPSVLFVGAGRHQRRGIARVKELGARVVAVDRNPEAPGLADADASEVVDFADADAATEVGRRHAVDGVMTFAADSAVPIVATVAEQLGLAGIGSETAHRATNKIAMRRAFAEHGVPQPEFAAVRTFSEARAAAESVGLPAVLKPADSAGQRGLFRVDSLDELDAALPMTLAASPSQEAVLERFHEGLEVNTLLVAVHGDVRLVTASDRIRPDGAGFGVALAHLYPSTIFSDALEEVERVAIAAVHAIGLKDGVAYPQLLVSGSQVLAIEIAARIPAGQMDQVPRYGAGVDLVEVALQQALGQQVPTELVRPRFSQPLAISFLTAEPGPLPTGTVRRVSGLDQVLAAAGVVAGEVFLSDGDVIRPVQVDGDRRGYVIALGDTNLQALERAESAARLLEVEVE